MRISGISAALIGCLALSGCQLFTAAEPVSEPDPAQARKASEERRAKMNAAAEGAHGGGHARAHAEAHAGSRKAKEAPADPHEAAPHQGVAVESATASHILIRYAGAMRSGPEVTRGKEEAKKLAEQVARKARAPGADFVALANEYTEDPSGKGRGGKLGTFAKGRMVPEFDKPLFELAPGEVSDVIETGFGFHIILREK